MDEYIQLLLTMIVAYYEYGDELKFNKNDITNFIDKHDLLKKGHWNERSSIILWREGYLSNEDFAKLLDLKYEDKSFWMVFDSFSEMLPSNYETEASFLDGEYEWEHGNFYDVNVSDYFNYYTEDTLQEIINFCDKKGFEIDDGSNELILITKENTKIINGEIIINNDIKLIDQLDELDELNRSLNSAICEAQESADFSEAYDRISNNFKDKVGDYKHILINENGKEIPKIYLKIDEFKDVEENLKNEYGEFEFVEETYGSIYHVLKNMEYFEFKVPDYDNLYGSIDSATLNEYTQNRLSWD